MSKPLSYEEEKAMRLWMRLQSSGGEALTEGEKIGIIRQAIEEIVREVTAERSSFKILYEGSRKALELLNDLLPYDERNGHEHGVVDALRAGVRRASEELNRSESGRAATGS